MCQQSASCKCSSDSGNRLFFPHRLCCRSSLLTGSFWLTWQALRRRLKCDGEKGSINCDTLPAVENFVSVARALQRSQHIPDSEFRIFVAADLPETYEKVPSLPLQCPCCAQRLRVCSDWALDL